MQNVSFDTFEMSGLDLPKIELSEKLDSLHNSFQTAVEPMNGYFGFLAADVASGLPQWSQTVFDHIGSAVEARIYRAAGLKGAEINGREVLIRDVDINMVDKDGISNLQRMERGSPPVDATGKPIELHHIGQKADSPLAELTAEEHRSSDNFKDLHPKTTDSEIDRNAFEKEKSDHWKTRAENLKYETSFKGIVSEAGRVGVQSGITAAGITFAVSTVDNVRGVIAGEISVEEAFADVAVDTVAAGAIGFGTGFISSAVAGTMRASSNTLIQSLGKANVPAAVISFGIASYGSVIDYAQGDITGGQLAYDLGENAVGVAGSIGGAALAGAIVGSVVPGAGTVVGFGVGFGVGLVGGMVGYAVATGAYATAIEVATGGVDVLVDKVDAVANVAVETYTVVSDTVISGAEVVGDFAGNAATAVANTYTVASTSVVDGAEVLRDKAVEMGQSVIDSVAATAPEALADVKNAMNAFAANVGALIRF